MNTNTYNKSDVIDYLIEHQQEIKEACATITKRYNNLIADKENDIFDLDIRYQYFDCVRSIIARMVIIGLNITYEDSVSALDDISNETLLILLT